MPEPSIEELQSRVAVLESQVAQLLAKTKEPPVKDWRSTAGMFTGNDVMRAIDEAALRYREEDRDAARDAEQQDDAA